MKARKIFCVKPQGGRRLHIMFGEAHSEGLAACGVAVPRGWFWAKNSWGNHVCPRCVKAMETIEAA